MEVFWVFKTKKKSAKILTSVFWDNRDVSLIDYLDYLEKGNIIIRMREKIMKNKHELVSEGFLRE